MSDDKKILTDIKSDVLKLSACKEQLGYNNQVSASLKEAIDEIKRFQTCRKDAMQFLLFSPIISLGMFTACKTFAQFSVFGSIVSSSVVFGMFSIPLVIDIVDLRKSKRKLLSTGYIDSFSKKDLDIKKNELESKYSKVQSDVNSLEESITELNDKVQNYLVDNIIKMDEVINDIEKQYDDFMNEDIDYRNTHLVLNDIDNEEVKKLTKSYGKI